jgi:ribonuclease R
VAKKGDLAVRIFDFLKKQDSTGLNKSELARALDLGTKDRALLRATVSELEREGKISEGKKSRYYVKRKSSSAGKGGAKGKGPSSSKGEAKGKGASSSKGAGTLIGTIHFRASGRSVFFADVLNEENIESGLDLEKVRRVVVPAGKTGVALDGDKVRLKLSPPAERRPDRRRGPKGKKGSPRFDDQVMGRVDKVLERRSGVVVGIFYKKKKFSYVKPSDESLPPTIELEGNADARTGQLVAVELTEWKRKNDIPRGRLAKVLGWPGDAGVDIEAIVEQHALHTKFPKAVMDETAKVPQEISAEEIALREDWRERDVITIDPVDAKDFDDAIAVNKVEGGWDLAVHIADVAHYVRPNSALDKEAVERGNSTYLVDRVIPMLPPELSNGICSLRPDVERLTCVAVLRFDENGKMGQARFAKAVIRSKARLTYDQAQEMLDNGGGGETGEIVRGVWELASVLRKRRFKNGALDLEFPEVRVVLDDKGVPTGYKREEYSESHQLIEECMLVANEAVARAIKTAQRPGIYRAHEDPDQAKLFDFTELARSHGYQPGDLTNRKHIQQLLKDSKGSLEEHAIKLGLLKSLKRAAYRAQPIGHYGLAKVDYAHFTSPIRRYADLVVHRTLEPLLSNPPKELDFVPNQAHCEEISTHISETERKSSSAEEESRRLKMMEYLKICSEMDEPPVFEAVITEVRPIGLMVEATEIMQRGVVKRERFPRGMWRIESHRQAYVCGKKELKMGQLINVEVDEVDIERGFVNYRVVE